MSNLADMYSAAKRWSDAIPLQDGAFKLARSRLGPDHVDTLTSMNRLAGAYLETARWSYAEFTSRECLRLREAKQPGDWTRYDTMSQLGAALTGQKKYAQAEPFLIGGYDGIKARERKVPAPHKKELAAALRRIVAALRGLGQARPGGRLAGEVKFPRRCRSVTVDPPRDHFSFQAGPTSLPRIAPGGLTSGRAIYFPLWIAYDLSSSRQDASFRLNFEFNITKPNIDSIT